MEMLEIGNSQTSNRWRCVSYLLASLMDAMCLAGGFARGDSCCNRTKSHSDSRCLSAARQMGMVSLDDLGRATVAPMLMAELHEL